MDGSLDDAMVVIQEASATITKVSQQLSNYEGGQKEVTFALKEVSERLAVLESAAASSSTGPSTTKKVKPPLFIKVSTKNYF